MYNDIAIRIKRPLVVAAVQRKVFVLLVFQHAMTIYASLYRATVATCIDVHHLLQVMIECVQNHTPDIIVIDEIGRPREVEAARTVEQRGAKVMF